MKEFLILLLTGFILLGSYTWFSEQQAKKKRLNSFNHTTYHFFKKNKRTY